jgi:NAD(P)-dependent dehydrogenase (short-subunit alcohol dehydrogenase family)
VALAKAGAKVVVLGRTAETLKAVADEIAADGGEAMTVTADVSKVADLTRAMERVKQKWKRLDIVVANAGVNGVWSFLEKLKVEEWDETVSINLRGTFLTVKLALPLMKRKGGSIVVVASVNGTRVFSNIGASAYSTTKAAQVAFARMCALELARHSIRVNTICPGGIESEIADNTQLRGVAGLIKPVIKPGLMPASFMQRGKAEDVGELVRFLSSDAARHISGTEIFIDNAQSLSKG